MLSFSLSSPRLPTPILVSCLQIFITFYREEPETGTTGCCPNMKSLHVDVTDLIIHYSFSRYFSVVFTQMLSLIHILRYSIKRYCDVVLCWQFFQNQFVLVIQIHRFYYTAFYDCWFVTSIFFLLEFNLQHFSRGK